MARACTTSQYFTVGTASALQITGDMTCLLWLLGTGAGPGILLNCYNPESPFTGYGFRVGLVGHVSYFNNVLGAWQESSGTVNDGAWHTAGFVITGTGAGAGVFWIDGSTSSSWTHSSPGSFTGTKALGALSNGSGMAGYTLAEIAIWNAALTPNEVAAYGRGILPLRLRPESLVAYWPMWGLHDPEVDFGPNKYPATLVAGPTLANHAPVMPFTHVWAISFLETTTPQFARPSTDTTRDNWEEDDGTTTNIFDQLDESSADDADYIRTGLTPTNDVYVTKLTSVTDPEVHTGHTLRYRISKDVAGGEQINLTVQLRQGYVNESSLGSLIEEWTETNISGPSWTTTVRTVAEANAANITDYTSLYVRIVANKP